MQSVTRVGIDLAKMFIQVHAVDAVGKLVCNKQLSRDKFIAWCNQLPAGCLVAMEACSGSHAWARKLIALGLDAKIIAANHVAPYRMEGKGGNADACCCYTIGTTALIHGSWNCRHGKIMELTYSDRCNFLQQ